MNDLNSSLIEGKIHVGSKFFNANKFTLISNRYFKKDNEIEKESCFVDVYVNEKIRNLCTDGREIRVVGRLRNEKDKLVIEAEHIEFRPEFNKNKTQEFLFDEGDNDE